MAELSSQRNPRNLKGELASTVQVMRDFGGMNVASPRESIRDDQFSWLENYMPIAPGNLQALPGALSQSLTYTGISVIYSITVNIKGVDYILDFFNDGSAYYATTANVTVQFAPAGTFTAPTAISYTSTAGVSGALIVDSVKGYYDFGVTTPFTLTNWNNGLAAQVGSPVILLGGIAGTSHFYITSGYPAIVSPEVIVNFTVTAAVVSGGTGYIVGDTLTLTGGTFTQPVILIVDAIGAGGSLSSVGVSAGGSYQTPQFGTTLVVGSVGPNLTIAGGSGTGGSVTNYGVAPVSVTVVSPGNFPASQTANIQIFTAQSIGVSYTPTSYFNYSVSGILTGTSIAAYAGRVWIGYGKSVTYTDVGSFSSFGGAGGQFTINDSYLHNNINALFSTNGYLYIFGDDNIDILSNVQVNSGVTSFSRQNLTTSVGTAYPQSIATYYRSVMFANPNGCYALSGATPQKISDDLDGLFAPGTFVKGLIAGTVSVQGILCMCWTLRIVDSFTTLYGTSTTRTLIVVQFKGKWFVYYPGFDVAQIVSIPSGSAQIVYARAVSGSNTVGYQLLASSNANLLGMIRTKLWDGGQPLMDKEVIRAGFGGNYSTSFLPNLTLTTDNEFGSQPVTVVSDYVAIAAWVNNALQPVSWTNNALSTVQWFSTPLQAGSYFLAQGKSQTNGGKYFGMTLTTSVSSDLFLMLAEEYRSTRMW